MAADNFSAMHFTQTDRLEYAETRDRIILSSSEIFMNRKVTLYNESICHFACVPLCWVPPLTALVPGQTSQHMERDYRGGLEGIGELPLLQRSRRGFGPSTGNENLVELL